MFECPTCEKTLDTEVGLKVHHTTVHGESIVEHSCEICENEVRRADIKTCSDECYSKLMSEKMSDRDIYWGDKISKAKSGIDTNPNRIVEYKESTCKQCGQTIEHFPSEERTFCDRECQAAWNSEAYSGEGNPAYIDGRSNDPYYPDNWDKMRREVYERDNYKCQKCGVGDVMINAHHIKPVCKFDDFDGAHTLDNLVTLCVGCHRKVHTEGHIEFLES